MKKHFSTTQNLKDFNILLKEECLKNNIEFKEVKVQKDNLGIYRLIPDYKNTSINIFNSKMNALCQELEFLEKHDRISEIRELLDI